MTIVHIDTVKSLTEERDALERQYHALAKEMIYEGNSVWYWYSKANAYKAAVASAWDALAEADVRPDGETNLAGLIRNLTGGKKV
jgi:hypothetical protein